MRTLVIVVKVGGSILGEGVSSTILNDIKFVKDSKNIVLVHGGGKEVTAIAGQLGKDQKFVVSPSGIKSRFTDKETASIYTMVMCGKMNKEMVASLQKVGIPSIGLSGVDGGIIQAQRKKRLIIVDERGRKRIIDGGYTGKINQVNDRLLNLILSQGYLPVISPVAISEEHEFLNVDGDRAAAYVAGGLKADQIIFLTDVNGLMFDGKIQSKLTSSEAKNLLPKIGFGMEKKVLASLECLDMGVKTCIISSGLIDKPISSALRMNGCTVITDE